MLGQQMHGVNNVSLQEELLIVRAKLWTIYTNNWAYGLSDQFWELRGLPLPKNHPDLGFFPAKVLRLR